MLAILMILYNMRIQCCTTLCRSENGINEVASVMMGGMHTLLYHAIITACMNIISYSNVILYYFVIPNSYFTIPLVTCIEG